MIDTKNLLEYRPGYILNEAEFLLKVKGGVKGFMTKLNKNGTMPVAFDTWEKNKWIGQTKKVEDLPIYIITETPREGWKIVNWRFGMSQNWAIVMHPLGFTVEIYLEQLLEIIKGGNVINGELVGQFSWKDHKLVKKK